MQKLPQILYPLFMTPLAAFGGERVIQGRGRIAEILTYGKEGSSNLGPLFIEWQKEGSFGQIMGWALVATLVIFLLHYLAIGPKKFDHDGARILVFSLFKRVIHWIAALSFVLLIPTGLMILYGTYFGGGSPVLTARYVHDWATVLFAISVIPMFLFWLIAMLPTLNDIKWLFIAGGYLSKKKREVPAGEFNAGQKMWFWLATLGGAVMIATGAAMYFQTFDLGIAAALDLSQIDLLRLSAIVHNGLAVAITMLFVTHLYMSIFAIKGSLESMIDGHKGEDEVKHLHSSWYKKLKKAGKI